MTAFDMVTHASSPLSDDSHTANVLRRNVRAQRQMEEDFQGRRTSNERLAEGITAFAGSMRSVYAHALLVLVWVVINAGWVPFIRPFDPYPFTLLAVAASVEAIFLTSFVLVTQNRMSEASDQRANLDLHVNLLAEHEITRMIELLDAVCKHLGIECPSHPEIEELKTDVPPELVLKEIARDEHDVSTHTG